MRNLRCISILAGLALAACPGGSSTPKPECLVDQDCPAHNPDLCSANAHCTAGACVTSEPIDCSTFAVPQCFEARCDSARGVCYPSETNFVACSDGDACTEGDACLSGECVPKGPLTCDESTPCKTVSCDPAVGCRGELAPLGAPCPDNDACTLGEICDGLGACLIGPRDCDDDNPCTIDRCGASGCEHDPASAPATCDDGDACTANDRCDGSTCAGTALPDGSACFTSACLTGETCTGGTCGGGTSVADGVECEQDFACVGLATCRNGACVGPAEPCPDDHNPCTEDACSPNRGCLYRPVDDGAPCDLDACATGGTCDNGLCVGLTIAADGTRCDSGSGCATDETCFAGTCSRGDASACLSAPAGPLPGGFLVTDNAQGLIALLDSHGNLATVFDAELLGAAGITLDRKQGDGFFVTFSGVGGPHTYHKRGWDGAPGTDVVHSGQWPLVGACASWSSSTADWLVSACGSNRIVHDYEGDVLFGSANASSSTRGVSLVSLTDYWLVDARGDLHFVSERLGGIQSTFATRISNARGLERHPWGFYVGSPDSGFIVQFDTNGRRIRAIPAPTSLSLWDFAALDP